VKRGYRRGISPFRAGVIALVLIAVGTYFAFAQKLPFTEGYRIRAVFENPNLVQQRSPVRIAGVDVGRVVKVERYRDTSMGVVTMEIGDEARPIHSDATVKVRPRIFLEGNFYLDVHPGSPSADEVDDGGLIPVGQTSVPVQLDQVLTALQADTRAGLGKTVRGLGAGLGAEPSPGGAAGDGLLAAGLSGGEALNRALTTGPEALRDSAIASDALRGKSPRDLSRLIRGGARASAGLADHEGRLGELISDFNTTMATMASRASQLEETVRLLGPTAANARSGFASLRRALPGTRAFARELLPGVRELPATIAAAGPWLTQATAFLGPAELGGLMSELGPATRELAELEHASLDLLPAVDLASRCATEVLIPTGNIEVDDGPLSAGVENYKELWHAMVG
jgi:phospholipid/cholesterol/gamma-HCH transport system substrate-binding protein